MEQSTNTSHGGGNGSARMVDRLREKTTEQLNSQKNKATDGLGTVANAVRETTQSLRSQQHDVAARYVEQAADQIERLSARLREKDVTELLNDAQRLARRRPALFVGTAFALGLIGARFLKSTADDTDEFETVYGRQTPLRSRDTDTYPRTITPPPAATPITVPGPATERH